MRTLVIECYESKEEQELYNQGERYYFGCFSDVYRSSNYHDILTVFMEELKKFEGYRELL